MKKALKISGIVFAVLLLILIITPFLFKGEILNLLKKEANKSLKAKVEFSDISINLFRSFPNLSVSIPDLKVIGVEQFEKDTLCEVKNTRMTIDLMSLISGSKPEIRSIIIDNPRISLIVLPDSSTNWDIAKTTSQSTNTTTQDTSAIKITLKHFEIINGTISYKDSPNKTNLLLSGIDFNMKGDLGSDETTLSIKSMAKSLTMNFGGVDYIKQAPIVAKTELNANLKEMVFSIKESSLKINDLLLMAEGSFTMLSDGYGMDLKFSAPSTDFKALLSMIPSVYSQSFSDVKTSGTFSFSAFTKGVYNEKVMPAFGLDLKVPDASFKYPSLPTSVDKINLDLSINNPDGIPDHTLIDLRKFHMAIAGNPIDASLKIHNPISDPNIALIAVGKVDLTTLSKVIPMEKPMKGKISVDLNLKGAMSLLEQKKYDQFSAKGAIGIEGFNIFNEGLKRDIIIEKANLAFAPEALNLSSFTCSIGSSDISAKGNIYNYLGFYLKGESLNGDLTIAGKKLDLNELYTPDETKAGQSSPQSANEKLTIPENITFKMAASYNQILFQKVDMQDAKGNIVIDKGRITLNSFAFNSFDGKITTNGSFATPFEKPYEAQFSLKMDQINFIKAADAFKSLDSIAPILKKVDGKTSVTLNLKSDLNNEWSPDLKSIQSDGLLNTSAITISGLKVLQIAADALKMEKLRQITINPTSLSYLIQDGKLLIKPFQIKSGDINGTIAGSTDLATKGLEYVVTLDLPRNVLGQAANGVINSLAGALQKQGVNYTPGNTVSVDLLIGGTFSAPTVKPRLTSKNKEGSITEDLKKSAEEEFNKKKQELETQAKAELEKQKQQAEERLKQEQEKLKADIEKKKNDLQAKAKREADSLKRKLEEEAKKKLKKLF